MDTTTFSVKGMTCGHCVRAVEGAVGGLDGVQKVAVDLKGGKASVSYEPAKVTVDRIIAAIKEEGYEAAEA
jgi:copper chaperone